MTWLTEGWPLFAGIGLVALITWGALRPYMKKAAEQRQTADKADRD